MSLQHRFRNVRDRNEARATAGGKRKSLPVEYERASELPSVDHEKPAASTRDAEPAPESAKRAPAKKKARRR
jgi:hypothetical protein